MGNVRDFDAMMWESRMNRPDAGKQYHAHLSNFAPKKLGKNPTIHSHVWVGDDVEIGDNVKIQAFAFIPNGVTIHNDVFIGPHVCFTNDRNPPSDRLDKTIVCDGARIGANATILPGIIIGAGALVGAGAVVTKTIPPGETWVGNPARKLK